MLDQPLRRNSAGIAGAIAELETAFGNRVVTSQAVREQHANTTTWVAGEPPDAVVYPQSADDVQQIVRICARHRAPVIAFGTGTSFEGHVNAPYGGVSIDLKDMITASSQSIRRTSIASSSRVLRASSSTITCATRGCSFPSILVPMRRSAACAQ